MRIQPINTVNFTRRLRADEKAAYKKAVQEGLSALDKKLDIIVHGVSTPSNKEQDTGIGSPNSVCAEKAFYPFLEMHGFSAIQTGPNGLLTKTGSPYDAETSVRNPLMTPLEKLTTLDYGYGSILSKETFDGIVKNRPDAEANRVNYAHTVSEYEKALREAFETYKTKRDNIDSLSGKEKEQIASLTSDFKAFREQEGVGLEKVAIYTILSKNYGTDKWQKWEGANSEIDKMLYAPKEGQEQEAQSRLDEIKATHKDEIDFFIFKQMLVKRAVSETAENTNLKMIGDAKVGFSQADVWANPQLFLEDVSLGVPPDFFSKTGQAWGFPVLDPKKIFNKDGSLGEGGKFLYDKYKTMFKDNPGGVRIDHIIGLVDPFVYFDMPNSKTAGRLYSSPENEKLKQYLKRTPEEYSSIMKNIVFAAAEEMGVDPQSIICEDLGALTEPTERVMKDLQLRGVSVTEFSDAKDSNYDGKNTPKEKVIMAGSHDNSTLIEWTDNLFKPNSDFKRKKELGRHARTLTQDVLPANTGNWMQEHEKYAKELMKDKAKFRTAKFAELFTSPAQEVQVFFADFFGMTERYNTPGTETGEETENWKVRVPQEFEKAYHQNLEQDRGLNLPEVLSMAIRHKGKKFSAQYKDLLQQLDNFTGILKEKE